jgi:hypothetical protein
MQRHHFTYRGSNISAILTIIVERSGAIRLIQSNLDSHASPPQAIVDGTLPVMRYIERELEAACAVHALSARVVEDCRFVKCRSDAELQPARE